MYKGALLFKTDALHAFKIILMESAGLFVSF